MAQITELERRSVPQTPFAPTIGPIRSDLSTGSIYPAQIAIPYSASVVPKGCRKPKSTWFFALEAIGIRVVDAPTAFHIRFPKSRQFGANQLDVLYFENKHWWPFHFNGPRSCMRGSVGNSLASLRERKKDLLGLLPQGLEFPTQEMSDVTLREIVSSGLEEAVARACRKIADNILISNHRIYQLGGEPFWVQRHEGFSPKLGVAGTGAYRTVGDLGLRTEVGHFLHDDVQKCIGWGRFWSANDRSGAVDWYARREPAPFAEIDVLIDDAVRVPREQVHLDALFRSVAARMTRYCGPPDALPVSCTDAGLPFASEAVSDRELSRRRLRVLADFAETDEGHFRYHFTESRYELHRSVRDFDPARWLEAYS